MRTCIIFVDASSEKCLERTVGREKETGRHVYAMFVGMTNNEVRNSMKDNAGAVDLYVHIKNNGGEPMFETDGATREQLVEFASTKRRQAPHEAPQGDTKQGVKRALLRRHEDPDWATRSAVLDALEAMASNPEERRKITMWRRHR